MEKTYKTKEVAGIIGIHPNTVRLYEDLGLISKPLRKENGYRIFKALHIDQLKVARIALQIEVLQNGLRRQALSIVKMTAACRFEDALKFTQDYIFHVEEEMVHANEAVEMVEEILHGKGKEITCNLKRKEVSKLLGITMDTLRNWELNGLLQVKRMENGYRVYNNEQIRKLIIIRSLKCANYSLSAILRMLHQLDKNAQTDIREALNTPGENEDIISVCDKLLHSLGGAKSNALIIQTMLMEMKEKY